MSKFYTIKETAELLKLAEGTIRNKISSGDISAVKVFGATRISEEEIERIVKPYEPKQERQSKRGGAQ